MTMGLAATSRTVAATALPLLCFSASQCSTAFVLRSSLSSGGGIIRNIQGPPVLLAALHERQWTTRTPSRENQLKRGTPLLSSNALKTGVRLAMAAEPAKEVTEAPAAEEPSIPELEEEVVASEEAEVMEGEEEEETLEGGDGETKVVAEEGEEKEEEEEEEVDPMAAVRQQIKDLENELLEEENRLRDVQDSVEEKGQLGVLRIAAQVDNYRKSSGAGTGDYEADAKAEVLQAMLPAFKPFEAADEALKTETERELKFKNSYQALYRQLNDVFNKMGATDFYGVVGEKFVYSRHEKASEEHNPIMKEGLIMECLSPGLELKKNVIRKAVCVVSLGPEKEEEEEESEVGTEAGQVTEAEAEAAAEGAGEAGGVEAEAEASAPPDEAAA